jgi:hypothetical protein
VGDQRLLIRKIELEFFKQECSEPLFDSLCFFLGADKRQCEVVCIPYVSQSSKVGVLGINRGKFLSLLLDFVGNLLLPFSMQVAGAVDQAIVLLILPSFLPSGVLGDEFCFYEPVEL